MREPIEDLARLRDHQDTFGFAVGERRRIDRARITIAEVDLMAELRRDLRRKGNSCTRLLNPVVIIAEPKNMGRVG